MKYINIKRYKFSTILKNINTAIVKNFNRLGSNFLKIAKLVNHKQYDFKKIAEYFDPRKYNIRRIIPRTYNIRRIIKFKFISSKFFLYHLPASIIFFGFLYLIIPIFFNYNKANIAKVICKNQNIECLIKGEVNYSFYPTPRIKIKELIITDSSENKNTVVTAEHVAIKLSVKNLLAKEKHKFKRIQLNNFEINLNLKNSKKYKNIFIKNINLIPITFAKGRIVFFNGEDYVATVNKTNINIKFIQDSIEAELKGKFLDDDIYISLNSKKIDNKTSTDIILKMSDMNFLTKANLINSEENKNITNGNILIKKGKNRITATFYYKDNELIIKKSNLRNAFLNGKLKGKIILLPYFDFNLDLDLSSINFTKLFNYFLALDKKNQKNLFNINDKINGKLNLSSDKIYSNYNLAQSLESRIKFYNGNISIEQFLLNFGKLGAADILGTIHNDTKFTNFKFESNIFIDNKKKFLSKLGIYNKKKIPSNFFISGNFDLRNIRISFYEISNDTQSNSEDINYIEKEFNELILEDGYEKLFHFPKFKEFIKIITS